MARPSDLPTGDEEAVEMGVLPPVPGGDRDPDLEVRSGRGDLLAEQWKIDHGVLREHQWREKGL